MTRPPRNRTPFAKGGRRPKRESAEKGCGVEGRAHLSTTSSPLGLSLPLPDAFLTDDKAGGSMTLLPRRLLDVLLVVCVLG